MVQYLYTVEGNRIIHYTLQEIKGDTYMRWKTVQHIGIYICTLNKYKNQTKNVFM